MENTNDNYFYELPKTLSNEETIALIEEYQNTGSIEARDKAVLGNIRLIYFMIKKYATNILRLNKRSLTSEDLVQEGIRVLFNAVETFDSKRDLKFSTFVSCGMINLFRREYDVAKRKELKTISLNQKVYYDYKYEKKLLLEEIIGDKNSSIEKALNNLEVERVKNQLLPYIPRKERKIFEDYVFNGISGNELALKYDLTKQAISLIIIKVKEKLKQMYIEGVPETDKILNGVNLGFQNRRYAKSQTLIKKYGRAFLNVEFLPTLSKFQKEFFKNNILGYYGQKITSHKKIVDDNVRSQYRAVLSNIEKKLVGFAKDQEGKEKTSLSDLEIEIDKNEKFVEEYGGRAFLTKYYLPTLSKLEKKIFIGRVLSYNGESIQQLAEEVGLSVEEFEDSFSIIANKLKTTNFEMVADIVDFAGETRDLYLSEERVRRALKRKVFIEKHGGVIKLRKDFYPTLPQAQRDLFAGMYLYPKYDSFESYSQEHEMTLEEAKKMDKSVREKLKSLQSGEKIREL